MKAAIPVNGQSMAVGWSIRKVVVEQVVPERGMAIVSDKINYTTEVPYRVQQGRGRLPEVGQVWYIDRSMGSWTFMAFVAATDDDFKTFSQGIVLPADQRLEIGDTNLYRSAANTLKTDDSFVVGGDLTIGTEVVNTPWTVFTPAWTANTTNPIYANSVIRAAYKKVGKEVQFRIEITFGSLTTFGSGVYGFSLPFAPVAEQTCSAVLVDVSDTSGAGANGGRYAATGWLTPGSGIFRIVYGTVSFGISPNFPFVWASGDSLIMSGTYECA